MAPPPSSSFSGDSSDSDDDVTTQSMFIQHRPNKQPQPQQDDADHDDDVSGQEEIEEDGSSSSDDEKPPKPEPIAQLVTPISSKPMNVEHSSEKKSKSQCFQRVFSEDDDITVLKSLAEYQEQKGNKIKFTRTTVPDFHAFLGKSLSIEVSDKKMFNKIRGLKAKYKSRLKSRLKRGDRRFSRDYDRMVFELSKKVWGDLDVGGEGSRKRKKGVSKKEAKKRARLEVGMEKKRSNWGFRFLDEEVKRMGDLVGLGGVEKEKAREVDKGIKNLRLVEMKHEAERLGLLKESLELIMAGLERSGI